MGSRTRRNRSRPIHPDITTWVGKVAAAGDGVPASALVANREFVKRCFVGGFWQSKMRSGFVATISANSKAGALCPLVSTSASNIADSTVSSGFNYSLTTGLTSSGGTSDSNTNFNPTGVVSQGSGQISVYFRSNSQEASYPLIGADSGASSRFLLHTYTDPNTYFDCYAASGGDRNSTSFSSSLGLTTGSRTSTTDSRIYQNGTQKGSTQTSANSNTIPNTNVKILEPRTFSYLYFGVGLTATEEAAHYQAVQLMQMRLGRNV